MADGATTSDYNAGIKAAAKFVADRRDAYVEEHGFYDPSTGATEFPGNGDETVGEWDEIEEGILALAAPEGAETEVTRLRGEVSALMNKADNFERAAVRNYRLAKAICDNINEFGQVTDHELYDALDRQLRAYAAAPSQDDADALRAENARLRALVTPLADIADLYDDREDDAFRVCTDSHESDIRDALTLGRLRGLRAALSTGKDK